MCKTLDIAVITIALILQVHFDEDQFEQHREDGKKLLRPFAKPNLLDKHTVNQQQDNSEQTTDPSNVQNIISCKF